MPYNDKKRASNRKSDAKYTQILIKPYKAEGAAIRTAAAQAGQSVQGWLLQAARDRMARDGFAAAPPTAEKDPAGPG